MFYLCEREKERERERLLTPLLRSCGMHLARDNKKVCAFVACAAAAAACMHLASEKKRKIVHSF